MVNIPNSVLPTDAAPDCEQVMSCTLPHDFEQAVYPNWRHVLAHKATQDLALKFPLLSAHSGLPDLRHIFLLVCTLAPLVWVLPSTLLVDGAGLIVSSFFWGVIWLRLLALSIQSETCADDPEMQDDKLPVYSVLIPLFREARVLPQLLHAMQCLNYPADKLDIKLILEETDSAMPRALAAYNLPPQFEILVVPKGKPQTKPRALNYGLHFARGTLLAIYDAEDIPEPMQLRQAARRFAGSPEGLACLQAELAFFNGNENWLTRHFTIEYAMLFKLIQPCLAKLNWPLPLSGTSNHFRTESVRLAGGWDAYNVTEDADLGIRLARLGHRAATLSSITYEEATSTPHNWLKQRARWIKGYLVTWVVHMRRPGLLHKEIGTAGFMVLQASLMGVVASAVLYPVCILLMGWKLMNIGETGSDLQLIFDFYFIALIPISWLVMLRMSARAFQVKGLSDWRACQFTMPLYWLCISAAGFLALWEFFRAPYQWNKTKHGVSRLIHGASGAMKNPSSSSA